MKKGLKSLGFTVLVLGLAFSACKVDTTEEAPITGSVKIKGIAQVGQQLTVDGNVDGSGKLNIKWRRANTAMDEGTIISGETGETYTVTASDVGKYLRVTVGRSKYAGTLSAVTDGPVVSTDSTPFIAVTDIYYTGVQTAKVNNTITLSAQVVPPNATVQTVQWKVLNEENASLSGDRLTPNKVGNVIVMATIVGGGEQKKDISEFFEIPVSENTGHITGTITWEPTDQNPPYIYLQGLNSLPYQLGAEAVGVSVNGSLPTPSATITYQYTWYFDGEARTDTASTFTVNFDSIGNHTLTVVVKKIDTSSGTAVNSYYSASQSYQVQ